MSSTVPRKPRNSKPCAPHNNPFGHDKPIGMRPPRPILEEVKEIQEKFHGSDYLRHNLGCVKNRLKRIRLHAEVRAQKHRVKAELKRQRIERENETGIDERKPRETLETKREPDPTMIAHTQDQVAEELIHAETLDEFGAYFDGSYTPKVAITTSIDSRSKKTTMFIQDLINISGGVMKSIPREQFSVRELSQALSEEEYTALIIVHEDQRQMTHMMVLALPNGPTAWFRMTNVYTHKELVGSGRPIADHPPEVVLTNFRTRLGRRVGRLLQSLFSLDESLKAHQVVTFHNQRDFIFFRAYRYAFEPRDKRDPTSETIARMHELGPQFTLKLKWLQVGIYDIRNEEYEFYYKAELDKHARTRFFL
ncbi:putative U3 small nucleolar ribonucleoprotein IMP4 [Giardia muris]|uniref:Putative U3 small nucleolar ribonucleoprotein IMP4 n=1 Tax=Giardia muris TaxID=5742 RepID=A0A4Z1T7N5_GIAMU|nr:putative U3 small nucleolar ribonucleoprotein IMP4 [Giardia muris]|eukprot:TNJ30103.1 putative U3 small nucleolar ribonucleoprotein IMP4 [Giardia muris]